MLKLEWVFSTEAIDWQVLSDLYAVAPLGHKSPEALEMSFNNSLFTCFLFCDGELIGAGRALADGVDCSYICDIALHPKFQGQSLGKLIVKKLVELSQGHKKIILYANPGKEAFYEKLGFKRMNTAMAIFENVDRAVQSGIVSE